MNNAFISKCAHYFFRKSAKFGGTQTLSGLRKTSLKKLPLAVAAMIEARTPNTSELAAVLPLATERADIREQWLRRLLSNTLLDGVHAGTAGPTGVAAGICGWADDPAVDGSDHPDLGNRFAILMIFLSKIGRSSFEAYTGDWRAPRIGGWSDSVG